MKIKRCGVLTVMLVSSAILAMEQGRSMYASLDFRSDEINVMCFEKRFSRLFGSLRTKIESSLIDDETCLDQVKKTFIPLLNGKKEVAYMCFGDYRNLRLCMFYLICHKRAAALCWLLDFLKRYYTARILASLSFSDPENERDFFVYAQTRAVDLIKYIINQPDYKGETLLFDAARCSAFDEYDLLLEYGAESQAENIFRKTPGHIFAQKLSKLLSED